jgi:subtilisin family serine protease
VALGDFDKDSDLDAFVANENQANLVWLNNGAGVFSDSGQRLGNFASFGVALGDLDADTDLDAFVANANGQANKVWLNQPIPNDPMFPDQWYLNKIDALGAWSQTQGSGDIIIAIIDSGVYTDHVDLKTNLWTNPDEIPDDGIDNDGNGYVDDIHGWDFLNNDNTIYEPIGGDGHGTNIAGIIAADTNNEIGIASVCPRCRIMPLKVGDTISRSILYAVSEGANVINLSAGTNEGCEQALANHVNYAYDNNIVFVAAAGNEDHPLLQICPVLAAFYDFEIS